MRHAFRFLALNSLGRRVLPDYTRGPCREPEADRPRTPRRSFAVLVCAGEIVRVPNESPSYMFPAGGTWSIGRRPAIVAWSMLLIVALGLGAMAGFMPRRHGDWGTEDFIEYWAAYRVAAAGENPYEPARLLAVEQAAGRADDIPLMMWNPPWLLVLMRPVLQKPYSVAASTWAGVNIVLAALACLLIASGYRRSRLEAMDLVPASLGSLFSLPLVMTLERGQVSLVLLAAVAAVYWGVRRHHDVLAGVALSILTVKPHLFFLLAVLVVILVLRERRWRIVIGAASGLGLLLVGAAMQSRVLVEDWWLSVVSPLAGAPPAYAWRTATLSSAIREVVLQWTGGGPTWPLKAIPIVAVALFSVWLWRRPRAQALDELFPLALCVSVIAAPFGWTFDHVVLAVPQVIVFLRAFGDVERAVHRWALVGAVLVCHLGLVVQLVLTGTDYSGLWWFPSAILAVWLLSSVWGSRSPAAT